MAREKMTAPEAVSNMEAIKWELELSYREAEGYAEDADISAVPVGDIVLSLRQNSDPATKAGVIERAQAYLSENKGANEDLDELAEAIVDILGRGEKTPDDKEPNLMEALDAIDAFSSAAREAMGKYGNVLNIPATELVRLKKMAEYYLTDLEGGQNSLEQMARDIIRASEAK